MNFLTRVPIFSLVFMVFIIYSIMMEKENEKLSSKLYQENHLLACWINQYEEENNYYRIHINNIKVSAPLCRS